MAWTRSRLCPWLTLIAACGCAGEGLARYDDAFCERALAAPGAFEAQDWVRTPSGEPRHFGALSGPESVAMIDALDAAGATRVVATGVEGAAASGLVFGLPADAKRRLALFRLYAKFARNEGYEPPADRGQHYLYLPRAR